MENKFTIRFITNSGCNDTLEVYKPFVESIAITFDYDVPTLDEFSKKIKNITSKYPWLVCLYGNRVIGYTYANEHRNKTAYKCSVETTVYLSHGYHRKGIATILYESLFSILQLQGYANVYAGVTIPNVKSEGFHKSRGFHEIGIFKHIVFKFGTWHDVKWFQLCLSEWFQHPSNIK